MVEKQEAEFGSDKFDSVMGKPLGASLQLSQLWAQLWTAQINSLYTQWTLWIALYDMLSTEFTEEEKQQSEAHSQAIASLSGAALRDWATGSQLIVSQQC